MVAKLSFAGSLSAVMNYNEKKVQQEKAALIHTGNYLMDKDHMNFYNKYDRLQHLNDLNSRVKVNTLHAKLAFHPGEKLSDETLAKIADQYMEGIGFKDQPYLVYRHDDAAHPHIHIVSTLVKEDGKRIPTHNIGRNQSESTRKAVEQEFNLERAEDHKQTKEHKLKATEVQKVIYGKDGTKSSIQKVLRMAVDEYKFASLAEYNALLRQYNVTADRGLPGSQTHQRGGLVYKVLDENGRTIGTPIKASAFHFKPTLKNLEVKMDANKQARKQSVGDIKSRVDWGLQQQPNNLPAFIKELQQVNIDVMARQNEQGQIYGLTYIDHQTRTVINGGDLGKGYAAKAILERFQRTERNQQVKQQQSQSATYTKTQQTSSVSGSPGSSTSLPTPCSLSSPQDETWFPNPGNRQANDPNGRQKEREDTRTVDINIKVSQLLSDIIKYHSEFDDTPRELKKDKRKTKRKHL